MLKFIKGHMESMEGIATYPMISLLIFFVFFTILFWWVFTATKEHIKEVSNIPLEDDDITNLTKE
ncbi:CcoQ/FixQ family Cbb3-type cytochrome c oxidase assembly chaperone [Cellulophaga omnivescoria]|uniref:CcoQ/FixQ family Cbb3-type cytochrome c oxidase assembly chaperone n=1 Tax=Cellulophaga omnivescoria TaxID=1888890 RepID=UPI0022F0AFAE|nr:CcoQ/FixQ family Cbb3-type cytochrome c oxidase assembly chaperone [Cellulophaga omnivescoria]WBU88239.1 CcoQ/FixQ family Cbb3-type cytochrome c oxidase assembly chaperone [Cellulophaga omnivescoria]